MLAAWWVTRDREALGSVELLGFTLRIISPINSTAYKTHSLGYRKFSKQFVSPAGKFKIRFPEFEIATNSRGYKA